MHVMQAAEKEGITPIELCDRYVHMFKELYAQLNVSYDGYVCHAQTH